MKIFNGNEFKALFGHRLLKRIVSHLIECCHKMRRDCLATGNYLEDKEDKIANRLFERFLTADPKSLRYSVQVPVNFNPATDTHEGRIDIEAEPLMSVYSQKDAYYTIEAKRIDGGSALNQKYVTEGIVRFVELPHKYSSHYGKNIMLAYVVMPIDVAENIKKTDSIQREKLTDISVSEMEFVFDDSKGFRHYSCTYRQSGGFELELAHLPFDFSDVIVP